MSSTPHLLFPSLPPELRNEIFTYLQSTPQPTNRGLPLTLKTFSDKHTTTQIIPIHHGYANLLALQCHSVQEASEYASWLRDHAVTLQVGVVFKGRLSTFVQRDWDKKMEGHLRKLVRVYPWLRKVRRWDVNVFWDPVVFDEGRGKRGISAGGVARDMLRTFIRCAEVGEGKKTHVSMCLSLDHAFVVGRVMKGGKAGLDVLIKERAENFGVASLKLEVRKAYPTLREPALHTSSALILPPKTPEERMLLEVQDGVVSWTDCTRGVLVVKMDDDGIVKRPEVGKGGVEGEFLLMRLGEEVLR